MTQKKFKKVWPRLDVGMVYVNQPVKTNSTLPFGGTKASGFGKGLSHLGITEFVNAKVVSVRT